MDNFGVTYRSREKKKDKKSDSETSSVKFQNSKLKFLSNRLSHTSSTSGESAANKEHDNYLHAYYDNSIFPSTQFYKSTYSPTLITTSRKFNRSSRMSQGPQQYHSFSDIVLDFCARTSSHGVPFIG